ncbi:uncharacterized protein LOC142640029 [Castanea sativa]|uniref:uncharacterized protein LOC142640029 n=1 Tax=Castanea sativa TaxID=21020 RepID=UPI003F64B388
MDGAFVANSFGLSGGLWVLWDSEQVDLSKISSTEQEIYALVTSTARSPWFTWSNHRPLSQLIQGRIDRVFVNPEWNSLFPEATVFHLEKTHSDYCPGSLGKPFKRLVGYIFLSEQATTWNRTQFGNLFQRKNRILARLKGIQKSLAMNPNSFLVKLENNLQVEFAEVSNLEEEFWAMKAKILWLGDRNTTFFHTSALVRQRRNRILCLKDRAGNWIDDDRGIVEFIREDFLDLFTTSLTYSPRMQWNPLCW